LKILKNQQYLEGMAVEVEMINIHHKDKLLGQDWSAFDDSPTFFIDGMRWRLVNRPRMWRPPTDFYETEENFIVRVEAAGMKESDFTLALHKRQLFITGLRTDQNERRAYHQMEIPFGEFSIEIELPGPVTTDQVTAFYREGFLKILLPKATKISVQVSEE
jgi:HSP20 family protein